MWADGSSYDGEWDDNCISGRGTYKWDDGRQFIGEWKNNCMDGEGLYTWADGRRYQGQYVQDKKHGRGKYTGPTEGLTTVSGKMVSSTAKAPTTIQMLT